MEELEFKGTKGEWEYTHNDVCTKNSIICECPNYNSSIQNWESNAKLIAAVPELLEALIMCINAVGSMANESEPARNAYIFAKQSIKKAIE